MVQTMEAVSKEQKLDTETRKLFNRMMDTIEDRLEETYPSASDDCFNLTLTPTQSGNSAYLVVDVKDGWIDEETVDNIVLGAAGESWVGLEVESPGKYLLT